MRKMLMPKSWAEMALLYFPGKFLQNTSMYIKIYKRHNNAVFCVQTWTKVLEQIFWMTKFWGSVCFSCTKFIRCYQIFAKYFGYIHLRSASVLSYRRATRNNKKPSLCTGIYHEPIGQQCSITSYVSGYGVVGIGWEWRIAMFYCLTDGGDKKTGFLYHSKWYLNQYLLTYTKRKQKPKSDQQ